ncbi:uroporphyrinogen decarboxylase family protein [Agromyces bauzanensis]
MSRIASAVRGDALPAPIFTPLVGGFAATITQAAPETFWRSAAAQAASLAETARLFGLDAITVGLDPALLAEAAGAEVDWSTGRGVVRSGVPATDAERVLDPATAVPLDVAARLGQTLGSATEVIGVVPGVATLARLLRAGDEGAAEAADRLAARLVIEAARGYGEARVAALLVLDDAEGFAAAQTTAARRAERVLANTAQFFGVTLLRAVPAGADADAERIAPATGALPADAPVVGVASAVPVTPGEPVRVASGWYTSAGELDPALPPELLHDLVGALRADA